MDSRRLVVWMSACILGFQGGTLLLDLGHCTLLSWLYLQSHGLPTATDPTLAFGDRPRSPVDAAVGQGLSGSRRHPWRRTVPGISVVPAHNVRGGTAAGCWGWGT